MTKKKISLIVALCFILVGAAVFFIAFNMIDGDLTKLNTETFTEKTYKLNEDFNNISIHSNTEDITFVPSDNGDCRVVFYEPEKIEPSASVQDGTLSIGTTDVREWYDYIKLFSFDISSKITVYLPKAEYASLLIEEDTGDVVIPKDFTFEILKISADTGDIACNASVLGLLNIVTSTGDIKIENVSVGDLDLSVSTGEIAVRSAICKGNLAVNVSSGKTNLTDVSCKSISSTGNTGDVTLKNVIAKEMISINRTTGDVKLEQCDAGELIIKTDTGDVTGSLLSEKIFITQSDTGRIEVPGATSGGKCKITTDTGDILFE